MFYLENVHGRGHSGVISTYNRTILINDSLRNMVFYEMRGEG
jgi:hypothetical protein